MLRKSNIRFTRQGLKKTSPTKSQGELTSFFKRKEPVEIEYQNDSKKPPAKKPRTSLEGGDATQMREARTQLTEFFGQPVKRTEGNSINCCGRKETILEAIIALIIAQNTSGLKSEPAYAALRAKYPSLDDVCDLILNPTVYEVTSVCVAAEPQFEFFRTYATYVTYTCQIFRMREASAMEIQICIKGCGFDKQKSEWIHNLLDQVHKDYGQTSLESLREKKTEEVKSILKHYKGVGPKTISCVLLFTMGRPEIPVDTHVHRTACRIGWVPQSNSRDKTYDLLNKSMPDDLKYDMHVLMFKLGQLVCTDSNPKCGSCPIKDLCSYKQKTDKTVELTPAQLSALLNDE